MAARNTKTGTKAGIADKKAASGLFSAFENNAMMERITTIALGQSANPEKLPDAQEKARYWYNNNWFVREVVRLRTAFYDFGFKIEPRDKANAKAVTEWEENNARKLADYRRDAWQEFIVEDAVAGIWRENGRPIVYPVEHCDYSDTFGEEKLKIKHRLTSTQIDTMKGLSAAERAALKNRGGEITLTHNDESVFKFDVLKRARVGDGFGFPGLKTLFTALAQNESMEVGDNLLAGVGRDVITHLKIGHEIKSGPQAGSKIHFCTAAKAESAMRGLKGKKGGYLVITNFDQNFEFPRPDVKHFDPRKYDSVIRRMAIWGMPLGQMVLERMLNPHLMPILKIQALQERELMGGHLNAVFNGMNPPAPVRVKWNNRCFSDARLFADLLKFGYQSGSSSQQTVREEIGYDNEQELERKKTEGSLPASQKEPGYDPAHSKPGDKAGGRKPGSADNP